MLESRLMHTVLLTFLFWASSGAVNAQLDGFCLLVKDATYVPVALLPTELWDRADGDPPGKVAVGDVECVKLVDFARERGLQIAWSGKTHVVAIKGRDILIRLQALEPAEFWKVTALESLTAPRQQDEPPVQLPPAEHPPETREIEYEEQSGEGSWALIIGVNYADHRDISALKYAVADARELADVLKKRGGYETILMTDDALDPESVPTAANILGQFKSLADTLAQQKRRPDRILFAFSGHGASMGGQACMFPQDVVVERKDGQYLASNVVYIDELQRLLNTVSACQSVVIIDACRDEMLPRDSGAKGLASASLDYDGMRTAVDALGRAGEGRAAITSTGDGQRSYEWDDKEHGVFSYYLLAALREGPKVDQTRDGIVSVSEAVDYVWERIREWNDLYPQKQQMPHKEIGASGRLELTRVPAPARLVIKTVPTGCSLWLDGERIDQQGSETGGGIAHDHWLPDGAGEEEVTVVAARHGFQTRLRRLTVRPGEECREDFRLEEVPEQKWGHVSVSSNISQARLRMDHGPELTLGPDGKATDLALPVGDHTLSLLLPHGQRIEKHIRAREGRSEKVRFETKQCLGSLEVQCARQPAAVLIDGYLWEGELPARIDACPVGAHTVSAYFAYGEELVAWSKEVQVEAGRAQTVKVDPAGEELQAVEPSAHLVIAWTPGKGSASVDGQPLGSAGDGMGRVDLAGPVERVVRTVELQLMLAEKQSDVVCWEVLLRPGDHKQIALACAHVTIESDPPGAQLFVNGERRRETTPCSIWVANVVKGAAPPAVVAIHLEVRKDGYAPERWNGQFDPGEERTVYLQLVKPWQVPGRWAGEEITGPDRTPMVWVPPGSFMMGSESANAQKDERPVHEVSLDGFWIHKTEVTVDQFFDLTHGWLEKGNVLTKQSTLVDNKGHMLLKADDRVWTISEDGRIVPTKGMARHPASGVTWWGAGEYAEHYGLSLPTEAQWEYAARGPAAAEYPWGDTFDASACACRKITEGETRRVGSHPRDVSWCGALDTAGNVCEWCLDWYGEDYYTDCITYGVEHNPPGPEGDCQERVQRGGSARDTDSCCFGLSRRYHNPLDEVYVTAFTGFRCVVTPEP